MTPTGRRTRTAVAWGDPPGRPGLQCRAGRSPPAPFGGDAFAGDDAEGVAQDRDLAKEEAVVRPKADQFGLHGIGGSLVQLAAGAAGAAGAGRGGPGRSSRASYQC